MSARFRGLLSRFLPKSPAPAIRLHEEEVAFLEGKREYARFTWSEVQEIVTFKRDLGIYDEICLAFRVNGRWFEVCEDAAGWSALSAAIDQRFPTIPPDWYQTVMLPPFETCYRVIYERT